MILYLDFDGVLHHYDVIRNDRNRAVLRGMGTPFEYAQRLEQILEPYPNVEIVLSTNWVRTKGYDYARRQLRPALRKCIVGATWRKSFERDADFARWWISESTRYEQIMRDVARRHPADWIALDDDSRGWPTVAARHLVASDSKLGLSEPGVRLQLEGRLAHRMRATVGESVADRKKSAPEQHRRTRMPLVCGIRITDCAG